ncbi:hypothetical protein F4823DRAFT_583613 [Ustulina deusta]|nr:hypothetical protein F4823DRAFT_583613 [Ustulina deusta]
MAWPVYTVCLLRPAHLVGWVPQNGRASAYVNPLFSAYELCRCPVSEKRHIFVECQQVAQGRETGCSLGTNPSQRDGN